MRVLWSGCWGVLVLVCTIPAESMHDTARNDDVLTRLERLTIEQLVIALDDHAQLSSLRRSLATVVSPSQVANALQWKLAALSASDKIDHLAFVRTRAHIPGIDNLIIEAVVSVMREVRNIDANRLLDLACIVSESLAFSFFTSSLLRSCISAIIPAVPTLDDVQLDRLTRVIERKYPLISRQVMDVTLSNIHSFENRSSGVVAILDHVVASVDIDVVYPLFDAAAPVLARNLESLNASEVAKMMLLYARVGVGPIVPPGTPITTDVYWADLTLLFPDLPRQIVGGHQRITRNVSGLFDTIVQWALLHSAELSIDDVAKLLISFRRARRESAVLLGHFAPQIERRLLPGDVDVETRCMLAIAYRNEATVPGNLDFDPSWDQDDDVRIQRRVVYRLVPFLRTSKIPLIVSSAEFALLRYRYAIISEVVRVRATEFGYLSCRHMAKLIAIFVRHGYTDHFGFVREVIIEMMTGTLWARKNLADLVDALVTLAESGVNASMLYDVFTMALFRDVGFIDPVSTSRIMYAFALVDLPRYAIGLLPLLVNVTFDGLSPHMITNLNSWRMVMPDEEYDDIMADYPGALADLFNRCFHWVRGQPPMDGARRCPRTGCIIDAVVDESTVLVVYKWKNDPIARLRHRCLARHGWVVKLRHFGGSGENLDVQVEKWDALHHAVGRGVHARVDAVLRGFKRQCDEVSTWTPMHTLAQFGRGDTRELIDRLKFLFSPDAETLDGQSPLDVARVNNHRDVADALVQAGGSPGSAPKLHLISLPERPNAPTLSLYVRQRCRRGPRETFLQSFRQIDSRPLTSRMESALHFVVRHEADIGTVEGTTEALVVAGVSVHALDVDRRTVLHEVARRGCSENLVGFLIEHGALVDAQDYKGQTPLHLAADNGRREVVNRLLDRGAHIDAIDRQGRTALHLAADSGRLDVIDILIQRGANDTVVDSQGCQPVDVVMDERARSFLSNAIRERHSAPRQCEIAVTPGESGRNYGDGFSTPDNALSGFAGHRDRQPAALGRLSDVRADSSTSHPGNSSDILQALTPASLLVNGTGRHSTGDVVAQLSKWTQYVIIGGSLHFIAAGAWARYRPTSPTTPARSTRNTLLTGASVAAGAAIGVAARHIHRHLSSRTKTVPPHRRIQQPRTIPVPWGAIVVGCIILIIIGIFIYRFTGDDDPCVGVCFSLHNISNVWYRFRVMVGRPPRRHASRFRS
ncbi:Ankyrin repeat domain-containing protein [Plasmodiophora brassicae]